MRAGRGSPAQRRRPGFLSDPPAMMTAMRVPAAAAANLPRLVVRHRFPVGHPIEPCSGSSGAPSPLRVPGPEGGLLLVTRAYELMVIFESDLDESSVSAQLKKIGQAIDAGDGNVATTDLWGLRRFAYEIDHKTEGIYVVLEIVTEAPNLDDLDRQLRLADEVVRHKIIRLPEREATRRGLLGDGAPAEASAPEAAPAPADAG